jgi:cyanophycin synthetase
MKVIELKATEGPNYWSVRRHRLIVLLLDLEEMEDKPSNLIPGFLNRLSRLIPSLGEHYCSEGTTGGFFKRVKEGTWMGHVIEHIALEIQNLAGMAVGFGRTRGAGKKGHYHVVFAYEDMEAGKYAALAAVRITEALIKGVNYPIQQDIEALRTIAHHNHPGPSTNAIIQAALQRNIPVIGNNDDPFIQLGYGAAQQRIDATIASTTGSMAVEIACNKCTTKQLLQRHFIPVPEGSHVGQEEALQQVIDQIGYPVVIKPKDGNQGKGATTSIRNYKDAVKAFLLAKEFGEEVICEKFISGYDYRILVIDYRFVAAARRTPAAVTGDGEHTIRELIDITNKDPNRGDGHGNLLTRIVVDQSTLDCIAQQNYTLNSILPHGHTLLLKTTANLSTGGTATDVTDEVHASNIALFERIARLVGLNICGIDVIAPALTEPITQNGGAILEVNAAPGFRMHLSPTHGKPRDVGKAVIDMLFPHGKNGRIPILAITGTNGKTTTTRLLAHIGKHAGYKVGYTTTDGIYIQDEMILKGDCTGPVSAKTVLKDPGVNMAVLECARGGILRAGLGFDECDIAIVTNVASDHLGLSGIDSLEKLARVKSVVAESVRRDGYAILNADDNRVYDMRHNVSCHVAFYSMDPDNPKIKKHVDKGGLAAVYENGFVTILQGRMVCRIARAAEIPITFSGTASFNIANILPASLAAYIQKIHPRHIAEALKLFIPSHETIPGRMNIFDFNTFKVIVDYAHNPHGVRAIGPFIQSLPASVKVGVVTGVGDRRDEDIMDLGTAAAEIFDEIMIRHDADLRGRTAEDIDQLICAGVRKVSPDMKITIITDELQAVEAVIKNAVDNSVTVIFADDIKAVITQVQQACMNRPVRQKAVA